MFLAAPRGGVSLWGVFVEAWSICMHSSLVWMSALNWAQTTNLVCTTFVDDATRTHILPVWLRYVVSRIMFSICCMIWMLWCTDYKWFLHFDHSVYIFWYNLSHGLCCRWEDSELNTFSIHVYFWSFSLSIFHLILSDLTLWPRICMAEPVELSDAKSSTRCIT